MMKTPSLRLARTFFLAPLIAASAATSSHAALLVYEGFAGYSTGELNGQTASLSSQGLSGAWDGSAYTTRHQVTSTGLNFAGLATSGGALTIGNSTRLSGIAMSHAGVAPGGTLYSSYLVQRSVAATTESGILTRIHDSSATATGGYFSAFADGRAGAIAAVGYDTSFNPANSSPGSSPVSAGETFIVISSFTNVGNSSAGNASLYVLSQPQYTNLLTLGLGSLSSLTVGMGADQAWVSASHNGVTFGGTFDSSDYLQLLSLQEGGIIDEVRYGTALADVLPVPEPSGMLLAGVAMAGALVRRTRKNR